MFHWRLCLSTESKTRSVHEQAHLGCPSELLTTNASGSSEWST